MNLTIGRVCVFAAASAAVVGLAAAPQPAAAVRRRQPDRRGVRHGHRRPRPARARPDARRFRVDDNGKRQTLTLFANDVQPITVIMLLDRSGSMKPNFDLEEQAAEAFVARDAAGGQGAHRQLRQAHPDRSGRVHVGSRRAASRSCARELQEDGPTPLWNAVDRGIDKLLHRAGTPRRAGLHRRRRHADEFQQSQQVAEGRDEARGRGERHGLRDRAGRRERHAGAAGGAGRDPAAAE